MSTTSKSILSNTILPVFLVDISALAFIVLMPAASHLTGIPFYFIEPMRIMLAIALVFSNRYNSYIIALILPLFSFLLSGHPAPLKMMIIMGELLLNAWLFVALFRKTQKAFISMFSAVVLSKILCYLTYWVVFSWAFVVEESQVVFLVTQLLVTLAISSGMAVASQKIGLKSMS